MLRPLVFRPARPMKKPELLAPAGTLKNLRYAFAYGADAVYAGLPRYSLRVRNNDFLGDNLRLGIDEARARGKAFYLTCNILPHGAKVKTFLDDIAPVVQLGPDALIMADPGLILQVRERWPAIPIHLSVQANTMNAAAVRFWQGAGISRIILSRELSLDEIAEIRQDCPDMELEVFVHGALCIAYSGRCLLSGYFNHRDANQGTCTNACRWEYGLSAPEAQLSQTRQSRHPLADREYLIEEQGRPGELMPILEDAAGTYIMNSKDLRAVEHVQRLAEIGIDSLKIEGRTKSHYYAARTAQTYRRAIDDAAAGRSFNPELLGELANLAHRGYTDGFYQRHKSHELQNYLTGHSVSSGQIFVGEVLEQDENGMALVEIKNKLRRGDSVQLISPGGNHRFTLEVMSDDQGRPMDEAPGGGYRVRTPLPPGAAWGLLARELDPARRPVA